MCYDLQSLLTLSHHHAPVWPYRHISTQAMHSLLCSGPCQRCWSQALNCPLQRHDHVFYSCCPTLESLRLLFVTEPDSVISSPSTCTFHTVLSPVSSVSWICFCKGVILEGGQTQRQRQALRHYFCFLFPHSSHPQNGSSSLPYFHMRNLASQKEPTMLFWKHKRHSTVGRGTGGGC